jgi:hypothetical protein
MTPSVALKVMNFLKQPAEKDERMDRLSLGKLKC